MGIDEEIVEIALGQGLFNAEVFEKALKQIEQIPASEGQYRAFGETVWPKRLLKKGPQAPATTRRLIGHL